MSCYVSDETVPPYLRTVRLLIYAADKFTPTPSNVIASAVRKRKPSFLPIP
jgi:hypothetical protein